MIHTTSSLLMHQCYGLSSLLQIHHSLSFASVVIQSFAQAIFASPSHLVVEKCYVFFSSWRRIKILTLWLLMQYVCIDALLIQPVSSLVSNNTKKLKLLSHICKMFQVRIIVIASQKTWSFTPFHRLLCFGLLGGIPCLMVDLWSICIVKKRTRGVCV